MYSIICKLVFVAIFIGATVLAGPSFPPKKKIEMKSCPTSKPDFQQCFKDELQKVIPLLKDGYPRLRIPQLEPFELSALDITKGQGVVSIDLSLQNIKFHGLSSLKLDEVQIDLHNLSGYAKLSFGEPISIVGSYTAKGKVQILPINGKGPCNITLVNPILELINLKGETVTKNGVEYLVIKNAVLKATKMSKLIMNLENLFQGNKELSDNLNIFINENWELLFDELKPAFEEAIITIVKEIISKVLDKIPLKYIFPK